MAEIIWTTEYVPVSTPTKSKNGWNFPYNGGDWPTKDDWYWVWACKPDRSPHPVFTLPKIVWWEGKQQRFLALGNQTVYAWHKAVPVKLKHSEQANSNGFQYDIDPTQYLVIHDDKS